MKNSKLNKHYHGGFKTPEAYFENVEARLFSNAELSQSKYVTSQSGFITPDNYFDSLEARVLSKIENKPSKVISIFRNQWMSASIAVAASITLLLFLFSNNTEEVSFNSVETASIENYILNTDITANDISQYLTDEDLNNSLTEHTMLSDDNIENYLLNNSNLEHLLID